MFLNQMQKKRRVRNGKSAEVVDNSMQNHYHEIQENNSGEEAQPTSSDQGDDFVETEPRLRRRHSWT